MVVGGDLNLPDFRWKGNVHCSSTAQQIINYLICEMGLLQLLSNPRRLNAVLDIFLIKPPDIFIRSEVVAGISDHLGWPWS